MKKMEDQSDRPQVEKLEPADQKKQTDITRKQKILLSNIMDQGGDISDYEKWKSEQSSPKQESRKPEADLVHMEEETTKRKPMDDVDKGQKEEQKEPGIISYREGEREVSSEKMEPQPMEAVKNRETKELAKWAEEKYSEIPKAGIYERNGSRYETDGHGRPVHVKARLEYSRGGTRDTESQVEAGGKDRHVTDDGGHLIATILGGFEGIENIVAMRSTINRGDYKKMENEIAQALKEGKKVDMEIDLSYKGDSRRPDKIHVTYTIDGKKREIVFDNKENSIELMPTLEKHIRRKDVQQLKDEIQDAKADGSPVSITSVKTVYDENGNPTQVIVGMLDETTGEKSYRMYEAV